MREAKAREIDNAKQSTVFIRSMLIGMSALVVAVGAALVVNLIGMGILPLQFSAGQNVESLGLTGREVFQIDGIAAAARPDENRAREVTVRTDGKSLQAIVRLDTPQEARYYVNGGILPFVLRRLLRPT